MGKVTRKTRVYSVSVYLSLIVGQKLHVGTVWNRENLSIDPFFVAQETAPLHHLIRQHVEGGVPRFRHVPSIPFNRYHVG